MHLCIWKPYLTVTYAKVADIAMSCKETGLLFEFHQHATGLHVGGPADLPPGPQCVSVDFARRAVVVPPAVLPVEGAAASTPEVVVAVCGAY